MSDFTIREYKGAEDAASQYKLWISATAELPRAWRSCLRNVQHQLEQAEQYPKCRLYAEAPDGSMLGYIGTHPPFDWIGAQHGPPNESLGWTIPFGYPWTHPRDATIEAALYDEMIRVTPEIYADFKRDIYIQRFRESWSRHLAFLEQRGWRRHARVSLIGRPIDRPDQPPSDLVPVAPEDLPLIATLSSRDDTSAADFTTADLQHRYDNGWIVPDSFWRLGDRGAFAIEHRGPHAAITVLLARPDAWNETLQAAASQAHTLGAREIYFTIDAHETSRRQALDNRGFHEVDAGVYYTRDAD